MANTVDIGKCVAPLTGRNKNVDLTAPTPQNTPLNNAPIGREPLSRPTVQTIGEEDRDEDDDEDDAPAAAGAAAVGAAGLPSAAIQGMIQDKLNGLVGRSSGYIESLPDEVRRRVEGLKGLNVEHQKIEAEFQREILALEKRFAAKYAPLYDRRKEIVLGQIEPTAAEVEAGEAVDREDDEESADDEESDEEEEERDAPRSLANISIRTDAPKGIPEFWLTALKNHVALSEVITERDEGALSHLTDVRLRYLDTAPNASAGQDQQGFQLDFVFAPNDHFTNTTLTKTYFYANQVGFSGDLVYDHAEGTTIDWKSPEANLTHRVETKKQRNKNTNETRTVKRLVPTESFFNFFSPPKPPTDEDDEDDEELDALEERLELDYQIGEDLKDRIIPHAVDFFTGKALHYENPEEWDEDEFGDDDDYDEDDDEDDDAPRRGGARQDPQECKQQ
ncbi:histone chaperone [Malassezia brasiliensis]|uniref:Histone chaperone n=1 Tax=Malassezia brasiliensis TaxID=1821822 RepID=A0AAF0DU15_9BASI|nr:histone chaperone [Malassezia brasiliensis]